MFEAACIGLIVITAVLGILGISFENEKFTTHLLTGALLSSVGALGCLLWVMFS